MSVILVTCHVVVVRNVKLRTRVRGRSEWKSSGWHKVRGHKVSRARKNIEQKGVSEDNEEQI